jgi:hypothetical protein
MAVRDVCLLVVVLAVLVGCMGVCMCLNLDECVSVRVRSADGHIYVGLARTMYVYIYGVDTVFLARTSPNIRSYTVYIYSSGQLYM